MTITRPSSDGGDVRDDDDDDDEVVVVPPRLLCMALSSPGWNIIWFVLRCRTTLFLWTFTRPGGFSWGISSDRAEASPRRAGRGPRRCYDSRYHSTS